MSTTGKPTPSRSAAKSDPIRLRYHTNAYRFLFAALRRTQEDLGRAQAESGQSGNDEHAHITGPELVEGIRQYALDQFGFLAITVFNTWGIYATDDFGRMVFELIERGEMRKTDQDQIEDFFDLFDFEDALRGQYQINVKQAFHTKEPRAKGCTQ